MKQAVLLTGHFPNQRRRSSMLWVSEALQDSGWHVTHVTVGYSWLSHLRNDPRLACLDQRPVSGRHSVSPTLTAIYGQAPIHPFATRSPVLDTCLRPFHALFPAYWALRLRDLLPQADLVIAESGAPVMLAPIMCRLATRAQRIYRVNDDIRLLNAPAFLVRAEQDYADMFHRISTASPLLAAGFSGHRNVTLDPMGIPHSELRELPPDPYGTRAPKEVVCAGTTQLDMPALVRIARTCPNWRIHVLGRLRENPPELANLRFHGECSFRKTVAHVAHADIGLAPYLDRPGVQYQTSNSNRILLYRHFGLPVLGPDRLCHPSVPALVGYSNPDWVSFCETRQRLPEAIPDWAALADRLVQNCETLPPVDVAMVPAKV